MSQAAEAETLPALCTQQHVPSWRASQGNRHFGNFKRGAGRAKASGVRSSISRPRIAFNPKSDFQNRSADALVVAPSISTASARFDDCGQLVTKSLPSRVDRPAAQL